jgi:hypothetical protein
MCIGVPSDAAEAPLSSNQLAVALPRRISRICRYGGFRRKTARLFGRHD